MLHSTTPTYTPTHPISDTHITHTQQPAALGIIPYRVDQLPFPLLSRLQKSSPPSDTESPTPTSHPIPSHPSPSAAEPARPRLTPCHDRATTVRQIYTKLPRETDDGTKKVNQRKKQAARPVGFSFLPICQQNMYLRSLYCMYSYVFVSCWPVASIDHRHQQSRIVARTCACFQRGRPRIPSCN